MSSRSEVPDWRSRRALRSIGTVSAGTATQQTLLLLSSPMLSRLYTPADFGALAVFAAIFTVLLPMASLRYELAIPIADDDDLRGVIALSGVVLGGATVLSVVMVVLGKQPMLRLLGTTDLTDHLWILPAALFAAGMNQVLTQVAIRRRDYRCLAGTRAVQGLSGSGVSLGLGALGIAPMGLLAGAVAGRAGGTARLWRSSHGSILPLTFERDELRRLARRYRRFPLYSTWVGLSASAGIHAMPLFLAAGFGASVAGSYGFAARIIEQPVSVLGRAIAQVYLGEAASLARAQPEALLDLFTHVVKRLALASVTIFVPLALVSPLGFEFVFGPDWLEAGRYAQLLCLMFAAQLVTSPISQTLTVTEQQHLQMSFAVARLVGAIMILVVCLHLGATAYQTVGVYAGFTFLAYVTYLAMTHRGLQRWSRAIDSESL